MKSFPTSLLTCLAVLISCVAWIAGTSWFFVHWLDLSSTTGWIIAGALGLLCAAAALVLRHEVLNAIELPDDVDLDGVAPDAAHAYGERQSHVPVLPVEAAPAFRVPSRYY
ncbi:MAG: hypothetical protein RLZZ214_1231 [Verrucomicrobiota bacterium]|jgi:hypothetical protein